MWFIYAIGLLSASINKQQIMQVMKNLVLSLSLVCAFSLFSQAQDLQLRPPLAMVLLEMAAHDRFESSTVGFAALKSKQYQRFEQLTAIATQEQLLDLAANHTNGVVRLYAFQALQQQKASIPESLLTQFKNDATKIKVFIGCVMDSKPINTIVQLKINNSQLLKPSQVRMNIN